MLPIHSKIDRAQRLVRMLEQDAPLLAVRVEQLTPEYQQSAKNYAAKLTAQARAELEKLVQEKYFFDWNETSPHAADLAVSSFGRHSLISFRRCQASRYCSKNPPACLSFLFAGYRRIPLHFAKCVHRNQVPGVVWRDEGGDKINLLDGIDYLPFALMAGLRFSPLHLLHATKTFPGT